MKTLEIDQEYLKWLLLELLDIPSPTGCTDEIVQFTATELEKRGIPFELTRRGAIRADLKGAQESPDRAIVAHLDTIGAMVTELKPNGRLALLPVGTWSSRFIEGARVTVITDTSSIRGTVLPLKASGHIYLDEVDTQPVNWDNVEVRIDAPSRNSDELSDLGLRIGDFVAVDSNPDWNENGYINARHLDDKAGVAAVLTAAKAILDKDVELPVDCHLLFTLSEEVGSGASHVLHGDVAEMVAVDNSPASPLKSALETSVTIAMMDSSGPFDYHLGRKLIGICEEFGVPFHRDVFRHYRCDAASAVEAGNDLRTALVCFGVDGSHGYERTHSNSLVALARLLTLYMQSDPTAQRDRQVLGPMEDFPVHTQTETDH